MSAQKPNFAVMFKVVAVDSNGSVHALMPRSQVAATRAATAKSGKATAVSGWTKGPWNLDGCDVVSRSEDATICTIQWSGDGREAEDDANARLIAAAPEMAEMLEYCRRWFKRYEPTAGLITGDQTELPMLTSVKALLARINGETK